MASVDCISWCAYVGREYKGGYSPIARAVVRSKHIDSNIQRKMASSGLTMRGTWKPWKLEHLLLKPIESVDDGSTRYDAQLHIWMETASRKWHCYEIQWSTMCQCEWSELEAIRRDNEIRFSLTRIIFGHFTRFCGRVCVLDWIDRGRGFVLLRARQPEKCIPYRWGHIVLTGLSSVGWDAKPLHKQMPALKAHTHTYTSQHCLTSVKIDRPYCSIG